MKGTRMAGVYRSVVILLLLCAAPACNESKEHPVAPTPATPAPTSGPRILLAGQSNALRLRDCCMTDAITVIAISSVIYWQRSPEFAAASRNPDLIALVWWQGAGDTLTPYDEYVTRLRDVIAIARTSNPELRVRIIELPDSPDRLTVRAAQHEVASDPGVELIPTNDLPTADAAGHYALSSYQVVRERIYRSLGR